MTTRHACERSPRSRAWLHNNIQARIGASLVNGSPVKTFGLTHIALSVRDPERAFQFYQSVIGCVEVYRGDDFIQAQTPGSRDVLVFQLDQSRTPGAEGGIAHFGFRLVSPDEFQAAVRAVVGAGGRVTGFGEFVPGEPFLFFSDLDGYTVELWYELPTPVDP
jgi:catechol 2,3-dioxygenase-like lactoylglutathione lyase family enzyme